jgi:hypothetical protein
MNNGIVNITIRTNANKKAPQKVKSVFVVEAYIVNPIVAPQVKIKALITISV